jgi:glucose-1-phosphate thymidylyltransferase
MSKKFKGILLAGGMGTRLSPVTNYISKQLLPIFDKPMIYYSLSTLMLANIRDILLICTREDISSYEKLLGDGSRFGISLNYQIQETPRGIADAIIVAKNFLENSSFAMILGDNIFWGQGLSEQLIQSKKLNQGATIFAHKVNNPSEFGVVELSKENKIISIEEKPKYPKSSLAITGLYFYDNEAVEYAESLEVSERGELEITDLNRIFLNKNNLKLQELGRGFAWLDTGTFEGLSLASNFVETIEKRQGFKIACLEEIAYSKQWLTSEQIMNNLNKNTDNSYSKYIKHIINEK